MAGPFLELLDIGKTYPGVVALDGVGLAVHPGEVIGLVGENGAGKSTLMKILGGVTTPSSGAIRVDGAERPAMTIPGAIAAGIAFVHQELNLFDNLDAAANVFIGREPRRGPLRLVDRAKLAAGAAPLFARLGVDFRPGHPGLRALAGAAAAGRDRQGPLARQPPRHHGRADLEPDPLRDRPAAAASSPTSRHRASASSSSRTASTRSPPAPTASWSCATAGWSATSPGARSRPPR